MEKVLFDTIYGKRQNDFYGATILTVNRCFFMFCNGIFGGGIIAISPIKKSTIKESTFFHCSGTDGGSLYLSGMKLVDLNSLCIYNSTAKYASAIHLENNEKVTINNKDANF